MSCLKHKNYHTSQQKLETLYAIDRHKNYIRRVSYSLLYTTNLAL